MVTGALVTSNISSQTSDISRTLDNDVVDHSEVFGATFVSAASIPSSFSTYDMASMDWAKAIARRNKKHLSLGIWYGLY